MYEVIVHTKHYLGMEPRAIISFELPKKELEELEDTDGWKFVRQFLERKSVTRLNLAPRKIADEHAECDARVVKGQRKLDIEYREMQRSMLSNVISQCMIQNNMTLENLDEACENVREVYRKNATMKG